MLFKYKICKFCHKIVTIYWLVKLALDLGNIYSVGQNRVIKYAS